MTQFSNEDRDVFLIKLQKMIDRGALISRYSRTANLDIRDLYRKEFEGNESRGSDFYKRVFLEYGDESVAELVTSQMGVQNVTNVATKVIEEGRVGLSFIEKSSRYVRYDRKVDGHYLYASPDKIGMKDSLSDLYEGHCSTLFDLYAEFYSALREKVHEVYPIETFSFKDTLDGKEKPYGELKSDSDIEIANRSYESSVRAKVLDEIRYLLPASTLTNMGITGNGRAFISLVQRLHHYALPETMSLADSIYSELENEFPELIDASFSKHGMEMIDYISRKESVAGPLTGIRGEMPLVELISYDEEWDAINKIVALSMHPMSGDLTSAVKEVESLPLTQKASLLKELGDIRQNRRHKPGRAFESTCYTFQVNTNYGAFRDFQRHRYISIIRGDLSTDFGYDIPGLISVYPELNEKYIGIMELTKKVYEEMKEEVGSRMAQYVVPYAYRYPVTASMNFRELAYFIELRSTPQAHEDLRNVAMGMYDEVQKVHPDLVQVIRFADRNKYPLGRVAAESRKEGKMRELDKRNPISGRGEYL